MPDFNLGPDIAKTATSFSLMAIRRDGEMGCPLLRRTQFPCERVSNRAGLSPAPGGQDPCLILLEVGWSGTNDWMF